MDSTCNDLITQLSWFGPYRLCATEIDILPAPMLGVYVLQLFAGFAGYPVFYVGKSGDIQRRLRQHADDDQAKRIIRTVRLTGSAYFSVLPLASVAQLAGVEAGLVWMLRPPCNDQLPQARPIFVPPPPVTAPFEPTGLFDDGAED